MKTKVLNAPTFFVVAFLLLGFATIFIANPTKPVLFNPHDKIQIPGWMQGWELNIRALPDSETGGCHIKGTLRTHREFFEVEKGFPFPCNRSALRDVFQTLYDLVVAKGLGFADEYNLDYLETQLEAILKR